MANLAAAEATARFEKIAAALKAADTGHSVTFSLAEPRPRREARRSNQN